MLREQLITTLQEATAFIQDGVPHRIDKPVKQLLHDTFSVDRVISRGFENVWLPRSPDLNPCDFYLVVPARISSQSSRHSWRSPLPHVSALIERDFGCVLGEQQTKQLPHVAKVNLVWQLGV
ncbi:hypothetical protein TNCV_1372141 [Trichonephila clavipes]|nr:hypothetical protein TNCV_1372141 [Trichonephila clavipes]